MAQTLRRLGGRQPLCGTGVTSVMALTSSAAAYGVLLREPLKPATPAEPQLTTAPLRSVMVMIVLLNDAWMRACPTGTFFFSRRRCLTAFLRSAMSVRTPPYLVALRRAPTVRFGPRR